MCGWEGTDTAYYSMLGDNGDTYNEDACPVCVNDYEHKEVDLLYKQWYGEEILKDRAEMCYQLEVIEIVL